MCASSSIRSLIISLLKECQDNVTTFSINIQPLRGCSLSLRGRRRTARAERTLMMLCYAPLFKLLNHKSLRRFC